MDIQELSDVSSSLAIMGDPALQQFAQSHKSDPYMVSLALNESNRRKAVRNAKQAQGGAPQGKVVDQRIAGMSPTPVMTGAGVPLQTGYGGHVQTELPENQGIGRLPAPNMRHMADGGIAGYPDDVEFMSGGGVPGYATGDRVVDYRQAIIDEAQMQGIPAAVALQISGVESNFDPAARPIDPNTGKPRSSATSFFQVIDDTFKGLGGDPKKRNDPMENIRVGVKSLAQNQAALTKQLGRPPQPQELYTTHFLGTNTGSKLLSADPNTPISAFLDKTDPKNKDKILTANPEVLGGKKTVGDVLAWTQKKMAPVLTSAMPIGSAQAGEAPSAARPDAASQIPGHSIQAPAKETPGGFLSSDWFQERAANLGLPRDVGRQVSNTLSAPTPLTAPAMVLPKQGGMLSGIASLGEKAAEKMGLLKTPGLDKEAIAALQRERQGIASLEAAQKTAQEAEAAAEAARMSGAMSGEANLAAQGVEAASSAEKAAQAAKVPSAAERIARTSEAREAAHLNNVQNAARAMEGTQRAVQGTAIADTVMNRGPNAANASTAELPRSRPTNRAEEDAFQEANASPIGKENIIDAAKEATPAKERKGFDDEDMLTLGLQLLAGKNPKFLGALGEAGLGTLAAKKAREKTEMEKTKNLSEEELRKAQAFKERAYGEAIERGAKEKNLELEAEKMVQNAVGVWSKSTEGQMAMMSDGGAKAREENRIRAGIYAQFGITPIMAGQAGSASGLSPADTQLVQKYLR